MSLTDDDWKRIESALAFRSSKLCEQGASSPSPIRESCYGWQPIETAPKDGTRILLLLDGLDCVIGSWESGWVDDGLEQFKLISNPSHWMPMPEPPKGGGE